ncbi:fibronectin type III domain-containing protein [Phthorimaea operculella]|nr:fibronectin type III domain-containing protein [Phthorimaea operculella]
MAYHSVDTRRRTKCNGLQGVQCVWWIWCVLLLVCTSRCAADDERNALIYPPGDVIIRYGNNLEMFCVASKNYSAEDLTFALNGKLLPSEKVNDTTIRLFIEKPQTKGRKTYYCKNHKATKNNVAIKAVYIASPPNPVTDFKCASKNLDVLNCSWSTPDTDTIFTNYTLTFISNGAQSFPSVAHFDDNSLIRYCYWNTTSKPHYRQQEQEFNITLVGENYIGSITQHFTIDHFSVVKPDPPKALTHESVTPHSVVLKWELPNNMYHFMEPGVEHKIEYQIAKIDNTSYFRQVNVTGLPLKSPSYKFNLTGLPYAHRQYGVRVYIRPVKAKSDEFWSDFSNIVVYTASEIPQKPPETIAGAFDQSAFEGGRLLYIYWKQLEEYDEAGANLTYKIVITQGLRSKAYEPDRSKSLGFLFLDHPNDVETLQAMEVRIRSFNEMGSSVKSSYLYIPAEEETRSLRLSLFTKLAYENGTYELSWAPTGYAIDNYTLFWCQHNTTNICSGRIDFTVIEQTKSKHIIHLPKNYRYQFAISANKGLKTSGMVWAKCDISKDGIAMFDFPIHFMDHDAPGKTFVKLKWSMDCTLKEGIINGYNISYCPVKGTSTICDNSLGTLPEPFIINGSEQMEATITNLRPYTTYQFTMALKTTYGLKTIENTTVRITTLEDTPTKPRNVTITDVQHDSLVITWDLPAHLNGHSKSIRYTIHYNDKNRTIKYEENKIPMSITLSGLTAFTNYTITLEACNEGINLCSGKTSPMVVRTRIGAPSRMISPSYNNNKLSWIPPDHGGGTLDGYQIRIVKDAQDEILLNTSTLSHDVPSCEGGVQNVTYQVRAYNMDVDVHHGVWTDSQNVTLPTRPDTDTDETTFYGDWSKESTVLCKSRDNLFLLFIIMGVLIVVGVGCGIIKAYKKVRKMEDIKPEFPKGLFIPEKDMTKFPFNGLYPTDKDEKPTSDEMLLLPNRKSTVASSEIKNSENGNCGSSEHTDSTALSDASQGPVDRQNSTSDESTHSSMQLEDRSKVQNNDASPEERNSSHTDTDSSSEGSPYFSDTKFKKNKATGYVQPVISPVSGYVQAVPGPFKSPPPKTPSQPTTSSYVMAGLPPPIFTTGVLPPSGGSQPMPSSGYVRAEDVEARNAMNFPRLGPSPTKVFGSESLPTMPNLPPPTKLGTDSSYIQLQSLDGLTSHKPTLGRNPVPFKPAASNGYVRPEDAVINKHLNFLASGQPAEESAILDPTMSPDAYCRFSWSTDPSNDNLHSLLANPPAMNPSKN